jgi:hypothetical protein
MAAKDILFIQTASEILLVQALNVDNKPDPETHIPSLPSKTQESLPNP